MDIDHPSFSNDLRIVEETINLKNLKVVIKSPVEPLEVPFLNHKYKRLKLLICTNLIL